MDIGVVEPCRAHPERDTWQREQSTVPDNKNSITDELLEFVKRLKTNPAEVMVTAMPDSRVRCVSISNAVSYTLA